MDYFLAFGKALHKDYNLDYNKSIITPTIGINICFEDIDNHLKIEESSTIFHNLDLQLTKTYIK